MERPPKPLPTDDGRRLEVRGRPGSGEPPESPDNRLASLAGALRSAAAGFEHEHHPRLGEIGHRAADQLERLERHLDRRDLDALVRDGFDLARRNPALVLGGLFAGGVVVGRALRRSSTGEAVR